MESSIERRKEQIRGWLREKHVGQAFQPAIRYPELRDLTREDWKSLHQYQRRLPHWELMGSTYFLTFRVIDDLGRPFEDAIAGGRDSFLASLVEESIWFGFGERYSLDAYVVMPEHVHLLLKPLPGWTLAKILHGIKGYSAREINRSLNRKGAFWQDENMDHLVRNEADWLDKFEYIHMNPVKAGLVEKPQDWPFSSLVTLHSKGRLESLPHILWNTSLTNS
jgi:putative transposase